MKDFATFLLLTLFVVASPGVDFALITKRTIGTGKSDGMKMALGLTSGALIHTLAAAFGLSIILMKSALAFEIIKYLGAIYLIYLGVSSFINKKKKDNTSLQEVEVPKQSAFKQGCYILFNVFTSIRYTTVQYQSSICHYGLYLCSIIYIVVYDDCISAWLHQEIPIINKSANDH